MELSILIDELLRRDLVIDDVSDVTYVPSNFVNGIETLQTQVSSRPRRSS